MKKYNKGLVSVIIPTYKRSKLLKKAIDSVLNQTYVNIELLVVNDNVPGDNFSKNLYQLLDSYDDKRMKLVEQDKHINGAAARNAGIIKAVGEYIAFLDDDDYWDASKIEIQVNELSALDSTWGAVSCLMRFYRNGVLKYCSIPYRDGNILFDILTMRTGLGTGSVLIRRKALDDAGYFDESLTRHQDLQLFADLTSKYNVKLIRKYLHNRETKDSQNRPDAKNIDVIKNKYFQSVEGIMNTLTAKENKQVLIMHKFDTANAFKKNGKKCEFIKRVICVFRYPGTVYYVIEKMLRRTIGIVLKERLQRKYM